MSWSSHAWVDRILQGRIVYTAKWPRCLYIDAVCGSLWGRFPPIAMLTCQAHASSPVEEKEYNWLLSSIQSTRLVQKEARRSFVDRIYILVTRQTRWWMPQPHMPQQRCFGLWPIASLHCAGYNFKRQERVCHLIIWQSILTRMQPSLSMAGQHHQILLWRDYRSWQLNTPTAVHIQQLYLFEDSRDVHQWQASLVFVFYVCSVMWIALSIS